MPLYRLLENSAFTPEMIAVMSVAFEDVCKSLGLAERTDPLRDLVARKVIECAQTGVRDPVQLRDKVLQEITGGSAAA